MGVLIQLLYIVKKNVNIDSSWLDLIVSFHFINSGIKETSAPVVDYQLQ